jgi:molecular chaperone DnaK (HSP70)
MLLGIDFGTTHTVVAHVDRGNYPVVSFEHGGDVLPSLLAVHAESGELRYGAQALPLSRAPGWTVVRSFKRLLEGAGPRSEVRIAGRDFLLLDLLEGFFRYLGRELLRANAGLREGEEISAAVAVPANASSAQRFLTADAFSRAGFVVQAVLNEPSAAGFEYAHRFRGTVTSRREHVLVYDLGGGTFDASLLKLDGRSNEAVTSSGIGRLGGDDFDEAILALALERVGVERAALSPEQLFLLLEECRAQKEAVNPNIRKLVLDLHALGAAGGQSASSPPLVLPVDDVYAACAPLVARTVAVMEEALRDPQAGNGDGERLAWSDLAGIYVVGGASSFPPVYRQLRERFGAHRVRRSPHPFGSCAIGLAIHLDAGAGYSLFERLTRNFGVFREEREGESVAFDVLIPKDTPLPRAGEPPLTVTRRYRAAHNLGHFRFVECARIDGGRPEGNLALWDELLFPFDPALRGRRELGQVPVSRLSGEGPEVEESYEVAANGVLRVSLRVLDDGYSQAARISPRGGA